MAEALKTISHQRRKLNLHKCCVELEVLFCGTDVIAPGQDALEDEGTAHRVEKSKMVGDAPAEKCLLESEG